MVIMVVMMIRDMMQSYLIIIHHHLHLLWIHSNHIRWLTTMTFEFFHIIIIIFFFFLRMAGCIRWKIQMMMMITSCHVKDRWSGLIAFYRLSLLFCYNFGWHSFLGDKFMKDVKRSLFIFTWFMSKYNTTSHHVMIIPEKTIRILVDTINNFQLSSLYDVEYDYVELCTCPDHMMVNIGLWWWWG